MSELQVPEQQPGPEQPSLARSRVFGALLIPVGLAMGWFWMIKPLLAAQVSGTLVYNMKAVMLVPMCLYAGVAILTTDLRDGQIRTTGPDGKPHLTPKGWGFVLGLIAVMLVTLTVWWLILRAMGFDMFGATPTP